MSETIPSVASLRSLAVLSYANGFTLWHYKSAVLMAAVERPGFFAPCADVISDGDMVLISAPHAGGLFRFDGGALVRMV